MSDPDFETEVRRDIQFLTSDLATIDAHTAIVARVSHETRYHLFINDDLSVFRHTDTTMEQLFIGEIVNKPDGRNIPHVVISRTLTLGAPRELGWRVGVIHAPRMCDMTAEELEAYYRQCDQLDPIDPEVLDARLQEITEQVNPNPFK